MRTIWWAVMLTEGGAELLANPPVYQEGPLLWGTKLQAKDAARDYPGARVVKVKVEVVK